MPIDLKKSTCRHKLFALFNKQRFARFFAGIQWINLLDWRFIVFTYVTALIAFIIALYMNSPIPVNEYKLVIQPIPSVDASADNAYKLPNSIIPLHYRLRVLPLIHDPEKFAFIGEINIRMKIIKSCDSIALHTKHLSFSIQNITIARLNENDNQFDYVIKHLEPKFDANKEIVIIQTIENLHMDSMYDLTIKYTGNLNDKPIGLYRTSYITADGQISWIIGSKMQPSNARMVFPCFDEPDMKATFNITIGRLQNMKSISNMQLLVNDNKELIDGHPQYIWDTFEETPLISTYAVTILITDFIKYETVNCQLWTASSKKTAEKVDTILNTTEILVNYYNEILGANDVILPKLQIILWPKFETEPLENFGILILNDDKSRKIVPELINRMLRQWFDNTINRNWWSGVFQNAANYFMYLLTDKVNPKFQIFDEIAANEVHNGFKVENLTPVSSNEKYERIMSKSTATLRMLCHILTPEIFINGFKSYLHDKLRDNSSTSNHNGIWKYFTILGHAEKVLDKNISLKEIMYSWENFDKFPILNVTRYYSVGPIKLSQEQSMFYDAVNTGNNENEILWYIPISYATQKTLNFARTEPRFWLKGIKHMFVPVEKVHRNDVQQSDTESESLEIFQDMLDLETDDWLIVNIQQVGFYRVNYDSNNWNNIRIYLLDEKTYENIHPLNRAQIIDDALNLARTGYLDYDMALGIIAYLQHETNYAVWNSAIDSMEYLYHMVDRTVYLDGFRKFYATLINRIFASINFNTSEELDDTTSRHKLTIIKKAFDLEIDQANEAKAGELFEHLRNASSDSNARKISKHLKGIVYCNRLKQHGGEPGAFDFIVNQYRNATTESEKNIMLNSLGCVTNTRRIQQLLNIALMGHFGQTGNDFYKVFNSLASNDFIGQWHPFYYLYENYEIISSFVKSSEIMIDLLTVSTRYYENGQQWKKYLPWLKEHFANGSSFDEINDNVLRNELWTNANVMRIKHWVKGYFMQQHSE